MGKDKEWQKRFKKALNKIKNKEKTGLIYHCDADGVCSAVVAKTSLERLNKNLVGHEYYNYSDLKRAKQLVTLSKKLGIKHLVAVDLNLDAEPGDFDKLSYLKSILLIDHHKNFKIKKRNLIVIKADEVSDIPPNEYPASKLSFDLFNSVLDIEDIAWKIIPGIYGDKADKRWKEFVEENTNSKTLRKILEIKKIIDAVEAMNQKLMNKLVLDLCNSKEPKDFPFSKYKEIKEKFSKELKKALKEAKKSFEKIGDLWIIEIKSKHKGLKSHIVNEFTKKYPDKVLIIAAKSNGIVTISGRCRSGYNVRDLLREAGKGLRCRTGGHVPAAGASLPKEDYPYFKKNLINLFKN